jgi:hypothetical protein
MAILPKAIYMINAISIEITITFITEIEKINPKVYLGLNNPKWWRYHNT